MDIENKQAVGIRGDNIIVALPKRVMTKHEALVHAAWIVVLADNYKNAFGEILDAVQGT